MRECYYSRWYVHIEVTDDLSNVIKAANLKHSESERLGLVDKNHSEMDGLSAHIFGEKAEFAFCYMCGQPYVPKVNVFDKIPDQIGCDVKAATSHNYNLLLRKRQKVPDNRPIVHMSSRDIYGRDWYAHGWIYWPRALKIGRWGNPGGKGKCLIVHPYDLWPMDSCPIERIRLHDT